MKKGILFFGLLLYSVSAFAMTPAMYVKVMSAVQNRDLKMLQRLVEGGIDVNSPAPNGMTPLCETVWRGDYAGYEMLQSQGASPYVSCMRRLPPDRVAAFYANQPPAHTYYMGRMASATVVGGESVAQQTFPYLSATEFLLAGAATGAILALGHGSPNSDQGNKFNWDAPLALKASSFDTDEYQSKNIPRKWTNITQGDAGNQISGINFLGAIKADEAYARGYTGYQIKREKDGTLKAEGEAAIDKNKRVKVAVVDEGVWTNHPDLKNNIGDQYNFVYGPCSAKNKAQCWQWEPNYENTGVPALVLYRNWNPDTQTGEEIDKTSGMSQAAWNDYKRHYADYVHQYNNANPVSYWVKSSSGLTPTIYGRRSRVVTVTNPEQSTTSEDPSSEEPSSTGGEDTGDSTLASSGSGDSSSVASSTETTQVQWYMVDENGNELAGATCTESICVYQNVKYESNYMNHGTHVAGLVGATKNDQGMMGVAYNAQIIPVKLDIDLLGLGTSHAFEGLERAVQEADIVNLSIGSSQERRYVSVAQSVAVFNDNVLRSDYFADGLKQAAKDNKILVWAAGNYTSGVGSAPYDASAYAYAPLSNAFNGTTPYDKALSNVDKDKNIYNLTNLVVSVVSLDSTLKSLEAYSAKCGGTMSYCVGAPGGRNYDLFSTVRLSDEGSTTMSETEANQYGYQGLHGTSMAAPIVSGALAVIKGAFPHLSNQQVTQILFATADYIEPTDAQKASEEHYESGSDQLGKYNSLFGRGLVNLDAATSPIGLPEISLSNTTTGVRVAADNSSSTVSTAFSAVAQALPAKMIVLDSYQRAFSVPTSSFVRVAKRENKLDGRFKSFMSGDEKVVAHTDKLTMAYSERHSKVSSQMDQGSVRFELKPSPRWQFKTYYSENTETSGGKYFDRLVASPYGKMKEAWGGAVEYSIAKNWQASVQGQIGKNGFVDEKDLSRMEHNRMSLFQSSVKYSGFKKVGLKVVAGMAKEQGSLFGMWGRGAFKTGNSQTTYVGAGMTLNLTDAITLEGMYYTGSTKVGSNNSLMHLSHVKSDSFAVTAAWQMDESRTMGLHISSPLRVKSGTARVTLPVARDAYQDIVYQNETVAGLKPSAREYDLGFYYTDALREDVLLKSEFGVRLNPDHIAGSAPDWRALVGMHWGL